MSEQGRFKHPVTIEAMRALFVEPRFSVRHVGPFDTVGSHGFAAATLAIVERSGAVRSGRVKAR